MNPATTAAADVFSLFSTDDKPREMPIVDPRTGTVIRSKPTEAHPLGQPAFILVCAQNSQVGDLNARELYERAKTNNRKANDGLDYDDLKEYNASRIAKLIRGWRMVNPVTREVMDFPYTPEAAEELMSSPNREWLRKQVVAFAQDDANFMMG